IAPPTVFSIYMDDPSTDAALPDDLKAVAESMREEAGKGALTFTEEGALRFLPQDTEISDVVKQDNRVVRIELTRLPPNPPDITAMRPTKTLKPFEGYKAISYISAATEEMLREAGTDYPSWVTDRYLQLPDGLPDRVRRLSLGLTPGHIYTNPYDKATQIENWLRKQMFYSTDIDPLPEGEDGVDYFLFTSKRGYSSYFGSAMTVMLRAIGIPARLVVGYSTGDWDDQEQVYLVRSANAHAWPEAYFPGYGWIPFEPVPIQPLLARGGVIDEGFRIEPPRAQPGGGSVDPTRGQRPLDGEGVPRDSSLPEGSGGIMLLPLFILAAVLLLAALLWYWYNRGLSRLDNAARLYGKMSRLAALGGFGPRTNYTPMEYGEALATEMDVIEGHVEHISEAYAQNKYSPQASPEEEEETVRGSWQSLRRTLLLWALKRRLLFWRSG
ncbi:MAG: transglutaminase family protein, partial [Dehalococcoidia bacterium]